MPAALLKNDSLERLDAPFGQMQNGTQKSVPLHVPRIIPPLALTCRGDGKEMVIMPPTKRSPESPCQSPRMDVPPADTLSPPYHDLANDITYLPSQHNAAAAVTAVVRGPTDDVGTFPQRSMGSTATAAVTESMLGSTWPVQRVVSPDGFEERSLTNSLSRVRPDSPLPRNSLSLWKLKTGMPELNHAQEFSRVSRSAPVDTDAHKRIAPAHSKYMATKAMLRSQGMWDSNAQDVNKLSPPIDKVQLVDAIRDGRIPLKAGFIHTPPPIYTPPPICTPPQLNMVVSAVPPRVKARVKAPSLTRSCPGSGLSRGTPAQVQLATQAKAMLGQLPVRRSAQ